METSTGGTRGVLDLQVGLSAQPGTEATTREKGVGSRDKESPPPGGEGLEVCKKRLYNDGAGMAVRRQPSSAWLSPSAIVFWFFSISKVPSPLYPPPR